MSQTTTPVYAVADIPTPLAKRYMGQLCKHFQHKVPVQLEEVSGHITFSVGECALRSDEGVLTLSLEAPDQDQLTQLQDVVVRHLLRFAFRDDMRITWRAA